MSSICPYPGLRPFNENESIFFKGREEHIDKIISQLQQKKYLMITGASGDGKSSLVYAGLIPRSRAGFFKAQFNNWLVVDFKPERSPLTNLATALADNLLLKDPTSIEEELSYGFSSLIKFYKESDYYIDYKSDTYINATLQEQQQLKDKGANLLILVDQFEELFTNTENFSKGKPSLQAIILINLIIETTQIAVKDNIPIYIVSTMRSDYVGDCAVFKGLPELMVYSQFFVPRLKRMEIHRAILEPAKLSGNKINNRLIERLINELGDGQDQLPILQHALNRIWRVHIDDKSDEMDLLHYAKVGGMEHDLLPADQKNNFDSWYQNQPEFKHSESWKKQPESLSNVLNAHARELFEKSISYCKSYIGEEISKEQIQELLKKIFTCLTKINDNRAVRNRLSVAEIKNIIGGTITTKLLEGVVNIYREPDNTLLRPFITEDKETNNLNDSDILDITHESLIRNWTELAEWSKKEQENVLVITDLNKQLDRWVNSNQSKDFLLTIGSVNYFNNWLQSINPNAYLLAKYNLTNLSKHQKIEDAEQFLKIATIYINTSEETIKRKQKILRAITAVIIVALLSFTSWAFIERNKAVAQQRIANQKTLQARISEKKALIAEKEALYAKNGALLSKEKAEQSEKNALKAKIQAESSKQDAIKAKLIAEGQRLNAIEQTKIAQLEKNNAEQQQKNAELQQQKAEKSELKSQQLKRLSVAQNLTLKSALFKKNKQLMGQLAVQAYHFNIDNGGLPNDAIIYEGLKNAYAVLDSGKHTIINNTTSETRALTEISAGLLTVDLDGKINLYNDIESKFISKINYLSPINTLYFNESILISGHENFTFCLWDVQSIVKSKIEKPVGKEFKGHRGLIRTAVFSDNKELIASAGKDSLILIWNPKSQQQVNTPQKQLKTTSAIKELVFVNNNSALISIQTDGKILFWNIQNNEPAIQVYQNTNNKPVCLAYNKSVNTLLVGLSDGTIQNISLNFANMANLKISDLKTHITAIEHLVFNKDYSMLVSVSADKTVKFYQYPSYFQNKDVLGGVNEIKDLNSKVKDIIFLNTNKLVAACVDKSIHIWETSSALLADKICELLKSNLTETEWKLNVGNDIPYQKTCKNLP